MAQTTSQIGLRKLSRIWMCLKRLAGPTGLEPAISCVTGSGTRPSPAPAGARCARQSRSGRRRGCARPASEKCRTRAPRRRRGGDEPAECGAPRPDSPRASAAAPHAPSDLGKSWDCQDKPHLPSAYLRGRQAGKGRNLRHWPTCLGSEKHASARRLRQSNPAPGSGAASPTPGRPGSHRPPGPADRPHAGRFPARERAVH